MLREAAFLFCFDNSSGNINEIKISNLSLYVDLANLPSIWIGKTENCKNVNFLERRYSKARSDELRKDLIRAVASHKTSDFAKSEPLWDTNLPMQFIVWSYFILQQL